MRIGKTVRQNWPTLRLKISGYFLCCLTLVFMSGCSSFSHSHRQTGYSSTSAQNKAAQARLTLGLAYLEQGSLKLAYNNLQRAMSYAPHDYQTHLAMALYEQRVGEYDKAHKSYKIALALAPQEGAALNGYGIFLCESEQYELAQKQFDLARNVTNYDTIAESLENADYCYLKQGQHERAQEFFSRALKYEPAKSKNLLVAAERYLNARQYDQVAVLLDTYQQNSSVTAESLWLQIRFASLNDRPDNAEHYGRQLAKHFSQSEQYTQFLAHEN